MRPSLMSWRSVGWRSTWSQKRSFARCARRPHSTASRPPRRSCVSDVSSAQALVLREVERLADEMVDFTQMLVRVPTVNPPGDGYADCVQVIGARLRSLGYDVESLPA